MEKRFPRPSGQIEGSDLPDKGTGTGVMDAYGAEISGDACNCMGDIKGTGSDPAAQDKAHDSIQVKS